MHRCLCIPEILTLVFDHFHEPSNRASDVGQKTLASLARACRLFSGVALAILWKDLYSLDPLLKVFPTAPSSTEDVRWLTFRKYAERVKTIHVKFVDERDLRSPRPVKQEFGFATSLQLCPKAYLPLLPNVTKLEWHDVSISYLDYSGIWLLKYLGGHAVTTIKLSFLRFFLISTELAVLAELPKLCPNVTSFTMVLRGPWTDRTAREMGRVLAQWPKLQTLHTSVLSQVVMDQLLARETLDTLRIDCRNFSPTCTGRIPDRVCDLSLAAENPFTCIRFLENVYASPIKFCLSIDLDESPGCPDIEDMFRLLPYRIDPSRLLSLTINPVSRERGYTLRLEAWLVPSLVQFSSLRELDLDHVCTAHMSDMDHVCLVGPLIHLRSLKLGTAVPSHARLWPKASIGAVIGVLSCCQYLETLHIVFDGCILPPGTTVGKDGEAGFSGEQTCRGWGVCNKRISRLCTGYSPITDATVHVIASCLRSIMPCLVQIEEENDEWKVAQDVCIESCVEFIDPMHGLD